MRDKNEVQTFLCSRRFYAAIGIPIWRGADFDFNFNFGLGSTASV